MSFNPSTSSYSYSRANHTHQSSSASNSNGYLPSSSGGLNGADVSTRKSTIKDKIGGLMNGVTSDHDLPLYKDKPRASPQKRITALLFPRGKRKRWAITGTVFFFILWILGVFGSSSTASPRNVGEEYKEKGGIWGWWTKQDIDWNARRDMVRRAFALSWDDYAKNAWGMDTYAPVSRKSGMIVQKKDGDQSAPGMGWIIVDALDTAILMDLPDHVTQARGWIKTSLDFSQINDGVSVFETTSKVLGGLLSAHYLSTTFPDLAAQDDDDVGMKGEDLYIEKAVDLADRILGAFDTPTGIPLGKVNLNTSAGMPGDGANGASFAAEVAALQMEFKYVSKITGEPLYWEKAERVMKAVDDARREDGLVPLTIDPSTGQYKDSSIRLGSRRDAYYENLLKQYLQTGGREGVYNDMWEEALAGIKKNLISFSKDGNFTVLGERTDGLKGSLSGRMDHSVCSMPGLIALSVTGGETVQQAKTRLGSNWGPKQTEDLLLAEELFKTCWAMHAVTPSLLAAETTYMTLPSNPEQYQPSTYKPSTITFETSDPRTHPSLPIFNSDFTIHPEDVPNLQSPYTIKSLYYLWRITQHPRYRHAGFQLFQSFNKYTKVTDQYGKEGGYVSLESVLRDPKLDKGSRKSSITGINDIMVGEHHVDPKTIKIDSLEPHWMAETLKYFYMLFSDDEVMHSQAAFSYESLKDEKKRKKNKNKNDKDKSGKKKPPSPLSQGTNLVTDEWFDLSKTVINSRGHIFPRFDIEGSKVFKTGWSRGGGEKNTEVINSNSNSNSNGAADTSSSGNGNGNGNGDGNKVVVVEEVKQVEKENVRELTKQEKEEKEKEEREAKEALDAWNSAERKEHQFGDVM